MTREVTKGKPNHSRSVALTITYLFKCGPLNILVGVCYPNVGAPAIIFMGSKQDFEPYVIVGTNLAAVWIDA